MPAPHNTEMSEKEQIAWQEGYDAYADGKHEYNNPYDPEDDEYEFTSWNDGWNEACEDDQ